MLTTSQMENSPDGLYRFRGDPSRPWGFLFVEGAVGIRPGERNWKCVRDLPSAEWDGPISAEPHPADADFTPAEAAALVTKLGCKKIQTNVGFVFDDQSPPAISQNWLQCYVAASHPSFPRPFEIFYGYTLREAVARAAAAIADKSTDAAVAAAQAEPDRVKREADSLAAAHEDVAESEPDAGPTIADIRAAVAAGEAKGLWLVISFGIGGTLTTVILPAGRNGMDGKVLYSNFDDRLADTLPAARKVIDEYVPADTVAAAVQASARLPERIAASAEAAESEPDRSHEVEADLVDTGHDGIFA